MRTAGICLLTFGCFLTVTIVWAAVGFVMMGFGLIYLMIAERDKKVVALHVQADERNHSLAETCRLQSHRLLRAVTDHVSTSVVLDEPRGPLLSAPMPSAEETGVDVYALAPTANVDTDVTSDNPANAMENDAIPPPTLTEIEQTDATGNIDTEGTANLMDLLNKMTEVQSTIRP